MKNLNLSAQDVGSWKFLRDFTYTAASLKSTRIFLYQVSDGVFGGVVPASNYSVTASTESECINECKAECDRFLAEDDDIPF